MSLPQNKALVRQYYEEIFNSGDVARLHEFISPDYTEIYNNETKLLGIEGAKEHIFGVRNTYPDIRLKVNLQIAEGDWVVSEVHMEGTHTGNWLGMKPTRKIVKITAVNIDKIIDGLIVLHTGAANMMIPFLEIGAIQVTNPADD